MAAGIDWYSDRTCLGDGNILKLYCGYGCTTFNIYKNSLNYTLKMYALTLHKFYSNKAVKINNQQGVAGKEV